MKRILFLAAFSSYTAQKMKFSIKDFFAKCDEIRRKLRIWSHLLKKSLMENFIFCGVLSLRMEGSRGSRGVFRTQSDMRWGFYWQHIKLFCKIETLSQMFDRVLNTHLYSKSNLPELKCSRSSILVKTVNLKKLGSFKERHLLFSPFLVLLRTRLRQLDWKRTFQLKFSGNFPNFFPANVLESHSKKINFDFIFKKVGASIFRFS